MNKVSICLVLLLSACSFAPDYERPNLDMPKSWGSKSNGSDIDQAEHLISLKWWRQFNDPRLIALLEEGLKNNLDLQLAIAKIQQLRAQYNSTESSRAPTLNLSSHANRISNSQESIMAGFPLSDKPYNDYNLSSVFNYEVDLWGRVSNNIESAKAQLLSVLANRDAVYLTILSDIAAGYFNLCALNEQILVTEKTLASRTEALAYQEKQNRLGALDTLNLYQAEAEVSTTKVALENLRQSRVDQLNALGILLGRTPRELVEQSVNTKEQLDDALETPRIPENLPSTLLERRPDIYAAEQDLISSNALVGVARADYFPTLSLSAIFGLSSSNLDKILQSSARTWQLQSDLSGPIFDLSKPAKVDSALALKEQSIINYKKTVITAFKEVITTKAAIDTTKNRLISLKKQVVSRKNATNILLKRYQVGYSTHLELLDGERTLYTAEIDYITAKRDHLTMTVNFAKALGGGWSGETLKDEPQSICKAVNKNNHPFVIKKIK